MDKLPGHRLGKLVFGSPRFGGRFNYYKLPLPEPKSHLTIRIGGPYVEMYVNDQFICRTWSNLYGGVYYRTILKIPESGPSGRGVVNVSNVRVKKWSGPPLALEDEKIAKYYQGRIKKDPTDKWSEFWLAQVFHRMKQYDKALVHYKKSIELGIGESHVAFYIGDIHDQQGDWDEAKKWYQASVDKAPAVFPEAMKLMSRFGNTAPDSYPADWSRFRLAWAHAMTAGEDLVAPERTVRKFRVPLYLQGMIKLLENQHWAAQKFWKPAIDGAQRMVEQTPEKYQPMVRRMAEAYENETVFVGTEEEARMYLEIPGTTPFFRHYEDLYPEVLKRDYRKIKVKSTEPKPEEARK